MFIGRRHELHLIQGCLVDTSRAQLIIIYGRRRVGKSTLIRESLKKEKNVLYFEGIEGGDTQIQIRQFLGDLAAQTNQVRLAATHWGDVFRGLEQTIMKGRWIVVMDEFPWLAAERTRIVSELKLYWDRWIKNNKLVLFLCGSVASFMVKHLVHSKALHNRKTLEFCLPPLSPQEAACFLPKRSSLFEKSQVYMIFGGIPKYLEQINPRNSLAKNVNKLCFTRGGFFVEEFETLFKEQFRAVKTYQSLVHLLSQGAANLTQISQKNKIAKGGGLNSYLKHLVDAQFAREYASYLPSGKPKKRTILYKLVDPFLLFYFRYMRDHKNLILKNQEEDLFSAITSASIDQYYGLAFERLVEDSYMTVLRGLGLTLSEVVAFGPYFQQKGQNKQGIQIDQLIMRRDGVWTVVECKYSRKPIDSGVIAEVEKKISGLKPFPHITIEPALITASGVTRAVRESGFFSTILTLEDLFPPLAT